MERVPVSVHVQDPISQLGVSTALRHRPELRMVGPDDGDKPRVELVVVETIDDTTRHLLRRLHRQGSARLVLVVASVDESAVPEAVECGVVGVVRRAEATPERLTNVIVSAARGEGSMPADLLGRLLEEMGRLQRQSVEPAGRSFSSLGQREIDVLRLISEGFDTAEIARKLCYSERTVKGVLYEITTRLQLRNRAHAVAYALRQGLI